MTSALIVTGANGFLGRSVTRELDSKGMPWCFVPSHLGERLDLRDAGAVCSEIPTGSTIIHLAARVPASQAEYEDAGLARENLAMVCNLLATRPAKLVFASSMTVYSPSTEMPVSESSVGIPAHAYGRSKLECEARIERSGVPSVSLRIPGLFGPERLDGLIGTALRRLKSGQHFQLDPDPPIWAGMHVEDAAVMCVRALGVKNEGCLVLNIGYDEEMSVYVAVERVARALNRAPPPCSVPTPVFSMSLARSKALLGPPPRSFSEAIQSLVSARSGLGCG